MHSQRLSFIILSLCCLSVFAGVQANLMISKEDFHVNSCIGCHGVVNLKSPGVIICPDCLIGRYCNDDCVRYGQEEHKEDMCQQLACYNLGMILKAVLGNKHDLGSWVEAVRDGLYGQGVLPDCCTEKQLDELSILWPRVYSMVDPDPAVAYRMLTLACRYAVCVPRPAATVQRLVHDSFELIKALPPASEEEGAEEWSCDHVSTLCVNVAELLAKERKPREAVEFIQSVKPNLEVALLLKTGSKDECHRPLHRLLNLYKLHSRLVRQCIPENLTRAERCAHPDRQRSVNLLKQAIKLGKDMKGAVDTQLAACSYDLGMEYQMAEDIDLALQVFQKSLKLPWNEKSANLAIKAVECHILAGRDIQAGKWIDQLLRLEEHCPGRLSLKEQALLYHLEALLSRRRGHPEEALPIYGKAQQLLVQFTLAHPDWREVDAPVIDLTMDNVDCLDALGQGSGMFAEVLQQLRAQGVRRPLEELRVMQSLMHKGREAEALTAMFEAFTDQMMMGSGYHYWRWRFKGVALWGEEMLSKWEGLVMQLLPEGERRAAVLARIEELRGVETMIKQKLLDDRRAQAIVEVREQVTGKPAAEGEGIMEGTGEAADEATGEATAIGKPSKAARKKRKKRQKKAAQAQDDSSQQGAEAGLEQSMAGLSVAQEDEAPEGEGEAGTEEAPRGMAREREECAICLNELGGDEGEGGLACGHVMHASCLRCWASKCASLSIETTCPVCREPIVGEPNN